MCGKIHDIIIPTQIHPLHTKIQCDGDYCKKKNSISAQKKLLQTNLGKEIVTHLWNSNEKEILMQTLFEIQVQEI